MDVVLIIPVQAEARLEDWLPGPLTISDGRVEADRERRSVYFNSHVSSLLYATECRWHQWADQPPPGLFGSQAPPASDIDERDLAIANVWAWELLSVSDPVPNAFAIGHFLMRFPDGLHWLVEQLSESMGRITPELAGLLPAGVFPSQGRGGRPYSICWLDLVEQAGDVMDPMPGYDWTLIQKWLWVLASATTPKEYPPVGDVSEVLPRVTQSLSRSWTACVLRDGASFVLHDEDRERYRQFRNASRLYCHTVYLDSFLLGNAQRLGLLDFADRTARLLIDVVSGESVAAVQHSFSIFRSRVWWQHVSGHGIANDLLRAYQSEHRLGELNAQVTSELNDYSQQKQTEASITTTSLVGLLTVTAVPATVGFAVPQVAGISGSVGVGVGVVLTVLLATLLLLSRPGRNLLRALSRR